MVEPNTEQTLLLYGYMVNNGVRDVELIINTKASPMTIAYKISLGRFSYWRYRAYCRVIDRLRRSTSIPGKLVRNWVFKRYGLKKMLHIEHFVKKSVSTFLGEGVPVSVEVRRWGS